MCYVVLRQLVLFTVIFAVKAVSSPKSVNLFGSLCPLPCDIPQPRAILLAEEIDKSSGGAFMHDYLPYMTILHRCGGSGCCSTGSICRAANLEKLNATVYVRRSPSTKFKQSYVILSNHTECSCQSFKDTPK